jgi:hypothetical protein
MDSEKLGTKLREGAVHRFWNYHVREFKIVMTNMLRTLMGKKRIT